jgi:hypothetical protein
MDEDSALEDQLRRAADLLDPVPPSALQAALAAFTYRTVDAELAELTFDSLAESAPVRGGEQPRFLTFRTGSRTIEIEITGPPRRIVGRLSPPEPAGVEIRHPAGTSAVTADALGRFNAPLPGSGPFSLRCGGVVTDWVGAALS